MTSNAPNSKGSIKRYFCLLFAVLALIGCCSTFLIRPVSAAEDDEYDILYSGSYSGWYHMKLPVVVQVTFFPEDVYCLIPLSSIPNAVDILYYTEQFTDLLAGKPFSSPDCSTAYLAGNIYLEDEALYFCGNFCPYILDYVGFGSSIPLTDLSIANDGFYIYFPEGTEISIGNNEWHIRPARADEFADYVAPSSGTITGLMQELFGTYTPVDGHADWSYIGGVLIFAIVLFLALYALCGVIKRR